MEGADSGEAAAAVPGPVGADRAFRDQRAAVDPPERREREHEDRAERDEHDRHVRPAAAPAARTRCAAPACSGSAEREPDAEGRPAGLRLDVEGAVVAVDDDATRDARPSPDPLPTS